MLGIVLLAAVTVPVIACGDDNDAANESEPGVTSTASVSATSAPQGTAAGNEEDRVAQAGDQVTVHYRGTLDDGSEFDSSAGGDPLPFTVGSGQVIEGFDEAVIGMAVGDKKTFRLEPAQAYGERTDERIITVPSANAPAGLTVGDQVSLGGAPAVVTEIAENGDVTVDANHPLAGQALTFEIELVSIQ